MRQIILLILVLIIFGGCASLTETIKGIASDPRSYISEATEATRKTSEAVPELPYAVCIGIGYLASFIRRLYSNKKRELALKAG